MRANGPEDVCTKPQGGLASGWREEGDFGRRREMNPVQ